MRAGGKPGRPWAARVRLFGALLLALLVAAPAPAPGQRLLDLIPFGRSHRLNRLLPTVVNISMTKMKLDPPQPGQTTPAEPHVAQFFGSGFIVDPSGIVVTNRHVVDGALELAVTLQNGPTIPARVLGAASSIDIALLKIDTDKPLPTVRWGDSDRVRIGDQVFAIGNPLGVGETVTSGIVSALNRDIMISPYDDFIQTDAAINHGNSGGPLFDTRGEVIGVNTAIISPSETSGSVGIGFAIPARDALFAIDRLRRFGQLRAGWMGLRTQDMTPDIAEALGLSPPRGVIVAGVERDGPAARAGIAEADVVLRFNNEVPRDKRALARMIAEAPVGQPATLTIWRDGRERAVPAMVQDWPEAPKPVAEQSAPTTQPPAGSTDPAALGLRLDPISDEARAQYKLRADLAGVLVEHVTPNSIAAQRRFEAGNVILKVRDTKVQSADDVTRALAAAAAAGHHNALLLVERADGQHWVAVPLGPPLRESSSR